MNLLRRQAYCILVVVGEGEGNSGIVGMGRTELSRKTNLQSRHS